MNRATRVFLVLLQLAIGWHLLYEGLWKLNEKSWSSKGYLRAAAGAGAPFVRWLAGDPDVVWQGGRLIVLDPNADFLDRFTLPPFDPGEKAADRRWHKYFPPPLEKEWRETFDGFVKHYHLNEPEKGRNTPVLPEMLAALGTAPQAGFPAGISWAPLFYSYHVVNPANPLERRAQRILVEMKFLNCKYDTARWLDQGTRKVKRSLLSGPAAESAVPIPQIVREYVVKQQEVRAVEAQEASIFGKGTSPKLRQARAEEAALRGELSAGLNAQTETMKESLREVLTWEQKHMSLPKAPEPPAREWSRLRWIDGIVAWGLTLVGAGLFLGLCTRTSCAGGALFLLLFYLPNPPLPGLPTKGESHYLFINDNIVEALALLAIAVSQPGRRYGLDFWIRRVLPWNRQLEEEQERNLAPRPDMEQVLEVVPVGDGFKAAEPPAAPVRSETPHGP